MKENKDLTVAEMLKTKYHKCEEVTNLKEMLYRSAKIYKARTAFKLKNSNDEIYKLTYEDFKNDVVSLGTSLINHGFLGKRIAVIGKNSYKWAVSYLAATIVGIAVPIDKELHAEDVINFLNISESECILGDDKNFEQIYQAKKLLNNQNILFISFDNISKKENYFQNIENFDDFKNQGYSLFSNGDNSFEEIKVDPDEMRILLFTSGTTGNAKGVCLSHRNICSNILSIYGIVKVKRSDLFFSILPLHHTYECTIGFLLPIYSGASICYCDGLKYILKNMNEYHPSVILCVPLLLENVHKNIFKSIAKSLPKKYLQEKNSSQEQNSKITTNSKPKENIELKNMSKSNNNSIDITKLPFVIRTVIKSKVKNSLGGRLRVFIVGAATLNPNIIEDFNKLNLNVLQGYGLTECSPLVVGNTDFFQKADSVGLPIPNVEVKIDNPNESGIGEISVKGPNVMLGYYNMPSETEKVLKNGWFHTGDLGYIDSNGYLYITGRCKSVIVTKNGKNIYPEEVEYYLNDSPLISESLVLGIHKANDDETYINAQIFPNLEAISEYLKGVVPTKEEIKKIIAGVVASVNSKLPNYKHIKNFIIRDKEFEKTTTQKIKRYGDNIKFNNSSK